MVAEGKRHPANIEVKHLTRFLGPAPFDDLRANDQDEVGVATGMAWTPFGGDILTIEVQVLPGKGIADADRLAGRRDAGIGAGGAELSCARAPKT